MKIKVSEIKVPEIILLGWHRLRRRLQPTGISTPNVENLAFNYDSADRITTITNGMNGSNTQTLVYDALDRLTSVTSPAETASYTYDADGNRTHQVYNGTATTFTYATTSNRLNSATGE